MKQTFSDSETQAILARALEIDAQSPDGIAAEQLASIAAELGISQTALEKAISEHGGHAVVARESVAAEPPDKTSVRQILGVVGLVMALALGAIFVLRLAFGPSRHELPATPPPALPGQAVPPPRIIPADQPTPPPTRPVRPPGPVPKKQR